MILIWSDYSNRSQAFSFLFSIVYIFKILHAEQLTCTCLKMHTSNLFFVASIYVQLDLMHVKTIRKQGAWELVGRGSDHPEREVGSQAYSAFVPMQQYVAAQSDCSISSGLTTPT